MPIRRAIALLTLTVFLPLRPASSEEAAPERSWVRTAHAIDGLVEAKLLQANVKPAERSDDAEFLRRLYLDVIGTVPTAAEAEAFLRDRSPVKRLIKTDELLASAAYADNWGFWWWKTLTGLTANFRKDGQGAKLLRGENGETFRAWLHDNVEKNRPYDQMAYDLVSATGRTDENGATGFYARWEGKPNDLAGATAKTFLGVRIQCAQCHDHVWEKDWKQKDFQGMAAFFNTSVPRRVELDGGKGRYASDVQDFDGQGYGAKGFARRMQKGKELPEELKQRIDLADVAPKLWLGKETGDVPGIPRRMLLARWITSKDNPYFARALVNRFWGHFFGRGIVHPVDDFGSFNEPSHPEVLDLLAKDFAESGYDLKRLIRLLVHTEAYQRTSRWEGDPEPEPALFARAPVRPLSTEQLYFSLARASGLDQRLDRGARAAARQQKQFLFAAFSFVFDDDEMGESEDFQGSIPQGLFLMNSTFMQGATRSAAYVQRLLDDEERSPGKVIRQLYLAAYGREPETAETSAAVAFLRRGSGDRDKENAAYEDLFWALLNSAEFMTNH